MITLSKEILNELTKIRESFTEEINRTYHFATRVESLETHFKKLLDLMIEVSEAHEAEDRGG